ADSPLCADCDGDVAVSSLCRPAASCRVLDRPCVALDASADASGPARAHGRWVRNTGFGTRFPSASVHAAGLARETTETAGSFEREFAPPPLSSSTGTDGPRGGGLSGKLRVVVVPGGPEVVSLPLSCRASACVSTSPRPGRSSLSSACGDVPTPSS